MDHEPFCEKLLESGCAGKVGELLRGTTADHGKLAQLVAEFAKLGKSSETASVDVRAGTN